MRTYIVGIGSIFTGCPPPEILTDDFIFVAVFDEFSGSLTFSGFMYFKIEANTREEAKTKAIKNYTELWKEEKERAENYKDLYKKYNVWTGE